MKAWRRSGGLGDPQTGCGTQVTDVFSEQAAGSPFTVGWFPTNQGILLTITRSVNGGAWVLMTAGVPDSDTFWEGGDGGLIGGESVRFGVRRDFSQLECQVITVPEIYEP